MPEASSAAPAPRRILLEVAVTFVVTLLIIRLTVLMFADALWGLPLAVIPILFMWAPVWVLEHRGVDPDHYPLAIPAWSERDVWRDAVKLSGAVILLAAVPYGMVYHFWQTAWFPAILQGLCDFEVPGTCFEARRAARFVPAWRWPAEPLKLVGYHLFFVAIPEELFYRGYMQSRLDEVWAPRWEIFGATLGPAWLITCVVFAFGHSLVAFQWWHFAIIVPSLVFGWMRAKTGDVMAGAFFHAWCNVSVTLLDTIYGVVSP
jgi:membrane protease YdiL (CAAX protease family)